MIEHVARVLPARVFILAFILASCAEAPSTPKTSVDILITGGLVFTGEAGDTGRILDVGVKGDKITFVGDEATEILSPERVIDATGLIVAPGFIDPHTHALVDLLTPATAQNVNYLTQGVTTVFVGNDGGGPVDIEGLLATYEKNGVGTNVAAFVGHGSVREAVMGREDRAPTTAELDEMRALVKTAMEGGALGLSAGLYYAPGSFADTQEVIELAKVAASYGGVYESHIRSEGSSGVGLLKAVDEALEIGRASGAPVHFAHIKALGVDVWGQSAEVITRIETAQADGQNVTADQYPWAASGTRISNALIPNWAKAGGKEALFERLQDEELAPRLKAEIEENLRRRGGPEALLIVGGPEEDINATLREAAKRRGLTSVDAAIAIVLEGDARVASFNMNETDIEAFMTRPWVMTSSDGTEGHPRKFGSFPQKYAVYVRDKQTLTLSEFIRRSTGLAADTFKIDGRGYIQEGYQADIVVFNPEEYRANADYKTPRRLSEGVRFLLINGALNIDQGMIEGVMGGRSLRRFQVRKY